MKRLFIPLAAIILLSGCRESIEERAAREAREMTETKCPMPVGDNMYLDSIVFDIPSHTQSQYFRVEGELDNDSVFEGVDTRGLLLKELKNTPSYVTLVKRGVFFHYVYRSASDPEHTLLELTLTPEDYGK